MASNLETTKKAYELFKQGDIPTLGRTLSMTPARGYPLALRKNCLGRVISRGGRRLQISSREWLKLGFYGICTA